ncbi:hypothetical protein ALC56_10034 [Trachymyrmex septentrionalis]|uniref:Uncharacterized protein n=1 Tax=Trachymyrmex septentrionalis TaxID=34720 RepID=A0A195F5L8_9HYME|nr:hypothetical protein ALC56_10034 [Trachymyrmex septentrionalis]
MYAIMLVLTNSLSTEKFSFDHQRVQQIACFGCLQTFEFGVITELYYITSICVVSESFYGVAEEYKSVCEKYNFVRHVFAFCLFDMELLPVNRTKLVKPLLFRSTELDQSLLLYSSKLKQQTHIGRITCNIQT